MPLKGQDLSRLDSFGTYIRHLTSVIFRSDGAEAELQTNTPPPAQLQGGGWAVLGVSIVAKAAKHLKILENTRGTPTSPE